MASSDNTAAKRSWGDVIAVYWDRRQLVIFLMGFSSGLPFALAGATLNYWLSSVGIDKTAIGLFALVSLPYSLKFLWAPFFDHFRPPFLNRWLGSYRGWILWIQGGLIFAILFLGSGNPAEAPFMTAFAALIVSFLSASQDIVIDAYRIDILQQDEQGAGAASTQTGWRVSFYWIAGAGALALSDFESWFLIYALMACAVLVGMIAVLLAPEPKLRPRDESGSSPKERLRLAVVEPFADFVARPGWLVILLFALLYKYGDAISGIMTYPFFVELKFTGVEISTVAKGFGFFATIAGMVAGGLLVVRIGIFKSLLIGGILQAVTNLLFALLASLGHQMPMLFVAIGADNFFGGIGSAAFVAYLSSLCSARFTATQYALLTSLMAFGRTVMSSGGGWVADQLDWVSFFILTTGLAIPGLILLLILRHGYSWEEQAGRRELEDTP